MTPLGIATYTGNNILLLISVVPSKMPERQLGADPYLLLCSKVAERSEASAAS